MIPITIPVVGEEESRAAQDVIRSGWLTQGPKVAEFERVVADYCGARDAVAVSSCTTALHLSLVALGIGAGDEVICPSMSFIATANAIRHAGATPVFADVDPRTYNLTPELAEQKISSATKAIFVVHQLGLPADIDGFHELAGRRGIRIVEDAACALGSKYKGKQIGGHSELVCFSFHPRKVITTGDGGVIATSNPDFAQTMRMLRHHGMSVSDLARHSSDRIVFEEYDAVGYNYRMTDLQAAVGIEQMKRLDWIVERRRALAQYYTDRLADHRWLIPPMAPDYAQPNYQSYAVQLTDAAPVSRNEMMQYLLDAGIATRRGVMLAHRERAYATGPMRPYLPASEFASDHSIVLPLFPQMTHLQQDTVLSAIRAIERQSMRRAS